MIFIAYGVPSIFYFIYVYSGKFYSFINLSYAINLTLAENLLIESKLSILSEDLLSIIIPAVSLEIKEVNVTVYNCIFDDEYWFNNINMAKC